MDKRSEDLHDEYVKKARRADQEHGGVQHGQTGGVEMKLMSFPRVEGIVCGNWGEASEATHRLVDAMEPAGRKLLTLLHLIHSLKISFITITSRNSNTISNCYCSHVLDVLVNINIM